MKLCRWIASAIVLIQFFACSSSDVVDISEGWRLSLEDNEEFAKPEWDDAGWSVVNIPGNFFKEQKKQSVWVRKSFTVPEQYRKKNLALYIGKIVETDCTYFNGHLIGCTGRWHPDFFSSWNTDRYYFIPPSLLKFGENNVIALRESAGEIGAVGEAVQNAANAVENIMKLCLNQESVTRTINKNFEAISKGSTEISSSISAQNASMMEVVSAVEKLNDIMRDVLEANTGMSEAVKKAYQQVYALKAVLDSSQ